MALHVAHDLIGGAFASGVSPQSHPSGMRTLGGPSDPAAPAPPHRPVEAYASASPYTVSSFLDTVEDAPTGVVSDELGG